MQKGAAWWVRFACAVCSLARAQEACESNIESGSGVCVPLDTGRTGAGGRWML